MTTGTSKTFCVQPWIHQMATSAGEAGFCCVASPRTIPDAEGRPLSLQRGEFDRAWNSPALRAIRKDMLEGRPVRGCETCYFQEEHGKTSHRQNHNTEWSEILGAGEIRRRVDESLRGGYALASAPVYLHLCLGNLCNLKCRMCNPNNSLMIDREWKELDAASGGDYSRFWDEHGCSVTDIGPWHENAEFWDSCERIIPTLKKVYMTGGEPTLIPGNYRFMRKCVELGRASQIALMFNINCTRVPDEFVDLIGRFGTATVNVSLDGIGAVGEYIRSPSRWSAVSKNLSKLLEKAGPRVHIGITPVAQVYNALDLAPLLEHVETLGRESRRPLRVDLLDCLHPAFLSVGILPRRIKDEAIRRLERFQNRTPVPDPARDPNHARVLENGVRSLIQQLRADAPPDAPRLLEAFARYTRTLDEHRGERLASACPDLAELLRAENCLP
jgi:hypothetical protein